MIYLAQFRFGTRLEMILGEFNFIVEACGQEEAEMKLVSLLQGAVHNKEWFPAPCRILLWNLAVMDSLPGEGLVFHQRKRTQGSGGYDLDFYPLKYLPQDKLRVIFDMDAAPLKEAPVPFVFVERDRTLSFPIENIPPSLW